MLAFYFQAIKNFNTGKILYAALMDLATMEKQYTDNIVELRQK
jgi:hypothetical protein